MFTLLLFVLAFAGDLRPTYLLDVTAADALLTGEAELVFVDAASQAEVFRQKVEIPWQGEVALDRASPSLRLEIFSPTFWSPPLELGESRAGEQISVQLFRRGEVTFTVERETPGDPVAAIVVEVSSVPLVGVADQLRKTKLGCHLEGDRGRCPAPALNVDLRLEKSGSVPVYVFGATVEAGKVLDLGRVRFARGNSLSGFVTVEEGQPQGATIAIEAAGMAGLREDQRRKLQRLEAVANDRGFFQVSAVAPGGYRLEAKRQGLAPTERGPVVVAEEGETTLDQPIHLERAAELALHVSPPTGPLGKPWKLLLVRTIHGASGSDQTFDGVTDEDGIHRWQGLQPGSYFVTVSNPDGEATGAGSDSIWQEQSLTLTSGTQSLYLDVPVIRVEGTFQAGDQPLHGRLIFGGFHGMPNVTIWSDEEGYFEGQLPAAGEWLLDAEVDGRLLSLKKVEVEPRGGRPAHLDIRLSDTRFHGKVTHKGEPVAGAELWGLSADAGSQARFNAKSDEQGLFDIRGLEPGSYELTASSARLRLGAPQLRFAIREGTDDPPVEIELEEFLRIDGQVHAQGLPVAGAVFGARLRARHGDDHRVGRSNKAGAMGMLVPESTREIGLAVAAAGFAWQVVTMRPATTGKGFEPARVELAQGSGAIRLKGAGMRGSSLHVGGADLPLPMLRQVLNLAGYFTDAGDHVVLEHAALGEYRVCNETRCINGAVVPNGILEIDFGQEKGGDPAPGVGGEARR